MHIADRIDLNLLFRTGNPRSEPDHGIHKGLVLDPQSTPERKVYRVHCDGRLDGKFAQIIYREYVASATQKTTVSAADSE